MNYDLRMIFLNFEVVSLDLVAMPSSRKMNYLLTMIDIKSKLLSARPLPNANAATAAENFFKHWICIYGPPTVIHSDQGQQFLSQTISDLCHRHSTFFI